jgi:hypothetical protein
MSIFDTDIRISKYLHHDIIYELISKIYDYKIQGIDMFNVDIFHNNKNKIIMTKTISNISQNIRIILIELNFLKTINRKLSYSNFYTYCGECGQIHAQHKYKNCGHSVNYFCAYNKLNHSNCCSECGKKIIEDDIKFIKSKEKEICSICLETCGTKLEKCGHHFHKSCIHSYYNSQICGSTQKTRNNHCPICRDKMFSLKKHTSNHINTKFSIGNQREGVADIIIQVI